MTIDELKQFCSREFENIDRIAEELFTVYKPDKTDYTMAEQAAVAALVMNVYSGVEIILKEMLIFDKLDVHDSPEWHEKVLKKSGEIGILPPELFQILSRYLSFRNFFIYSYVFNIKWEDLRALVDPLRGVIDNLKSEVNEYLLTI
ncbi:MAG: hypothetical protein ABFR82_11940 [Nitrospirota bacterium]